jgi:hypothetical protein
VVPNPGFVGIPEFLLVQVSPLGATGMVQIKDGTTPLAGPVPVNFGFALIIKSLPAGPHSLTAEFTPANPADFTPSTSAPVQVTINPLF